jgi:hypothetical protein
MSRSVKLRASAGVVLLLVALAVVGSTSMGTASARPRQGRMLNRPVAEISHALPVPSTAAYLPWQSIDLKNEPRILRARPWTLLFVTPMTWPAEPEAGAMPHLVMYRLYYDAVTDTSELWRYEDVPNAAGTYSGSITGVMNYSGSEPTIAGRPAFNANEKTMGEGHALVARGVVNASSWMPNPRPLFSYEYFEEADGLYHWAPEIIGKDYRSQIVAVEIDLYRGSYDGSAGPHYQVFVATATLPPLP